MLSSIVRGKRLTLATFSVEDPSQALKRFNNSLRKALAVSKDDLRVMLAEKRTLMEEKRLIEGKKKRGPKPRSLVSGPAVSGKD